MLNGGQYPASVLSPSGTKICINVYEPFWKISVGANFPVNTTIHSDHQMCSEPWFPVLQLYLLSHTLRIYLD